eukprot:2847045-Rhodomonas_salina.3
MSGTEIGYAATRAMLLHLNTNLSPPPKHKICVQVHYRPMRLLCDVRYSRSVAGPVFLRRCYTVSGADVAYRAPPSMQCPVLTSFSGAQFEALRGKIDAEPREPRYLPTR